MKKLKEYCWYSKNAGGRTRGAGTKKPNKWGIAVLLFVTGMTLRADSVILGFGVFGMLKNKIYRIK